MANGPTLITTTTVGSATPSVTFGTISQSYSDLYIIGSMRNSANNDGALVRFNGSSSSIYYERSLYSSGSAAGAQITGAGAAQTQFLGYGNMTPSTYTANGYSNFSIYIPNYSGTIIQKAATQFGTAENNATGVTLYQWIWTWASTAAINSITFTAGSSGNIAAGSVISLYGITKA